VEDLSAAGRIAAAGGTALAGALARLARVLRTRRRHRLGRGDRERCYGQAGQGRDPAQCLATTGERGMAEPRIPALSSGRPPVDEPGSREAAQRQLHGQGSGRLPDLGLDPVCDLGDGSAGCPRPPHREGHRPEAVGSVRCPVVEDRLHADPALEKRWPGLVGSGLLHEGRMARRPTRTQPVGRSIRPPQFRLSRWSAASTRKM
jgi:hypothetical protein